MLCAGVAVLQLQSGEPIWATLAHCLDRSRISLINLEALRLLSLLGVGILDNLSASQVPNFLTCAMCLYTQHQI